MLTTGQIHVLFSTMPPALPHVKSGKLRALGVTSRTRAKAAPDVPTIIEAGVPGFDVLNWQLRRETRRSASEAPPPAFTPA